MNAVMKNVDYNWKDELECRPDVWNLIIENEKTLYSVAHNFNIVTGNFLGNDKIEDLKCEIALWVVDKGGFKGNNSKGFSAFIKNKNTKTKMFDFLTKVHLPHQLSRGKRDKINRKIHFLQTKIEIFETLNAYVDNFSMWSTKRDVLVNELSQEKETLLAEYKNGKNPHTIKKEKANMLGEFIEELEGVPFKFIQTAYIEGEIHSEHSSKGGSFVDTVSSKNNDFDDNDFSVFDYAAFDEYDDSIYEESTNIMSCETINNYLSNNNKKKFVEWLVALEPYKREAEIVFNLILDISSVAICQNNYNDIKTGYKIDILSDELNKIESKFYGLLKKYVEFNENINFDTNHSDFVQRNDKRILKKHFSITDSLILNPTKFEKQD